MLEENGPTGNPSGLSTGVDQESDIETFEQSKKRSVTFEDDDRLVSAVFELPTPWANLEPMGPYELMAAYKIRCDMEGKEPLYSVLSQLQNINLKDTYARRPCFGLKGTQLNSVHIELLEEVLKRVQFEYMDLENSNLDDDCVVALCEMMEFYESCTELCLARNPNVTERGLHAIAHLIRKLHCLRWLDLRSISAMPLHSNVFARAIRSQAMNCRAEISKFLKIDILNQATPQLSTEPSKTCTSTNIQSHDLSQRIMPYIGLRGLHLGSTGVKGLPLSRLINALRLRAVNDLRLPMNQLGPSDATLLTPLLRYCASLQYLDLSRNQLGDVGCEAIANALATTAYPTTSPPYTATGGLRFLDLSSNNLSSSSMALLGNALSKCTQFVCLQLSNNSGIGCIGVSELQHGLLHCRTLKRLGMANCQIKCIGAVALAELVADRPRRLKMVDFRGNAIGPAGLLALSRCIRNVDHRINVELTDTYHSQIETVSRTDTIDMDSMYEESLELFKRAIFENHQTYPHNPTVPSQRYCEIACPDWLNSKATALDDASDPRYLWGDSSDDEDEGSVNKATLDEGCARKYPLADPIYPSSPPPSPIVTTMSETNHLVAEDRITSASRISDNDLVSVCLDPECTSSGTDQTDHFVFDAPQPDSTGSPSDCMVDGVLGPKRDESIADLIVLDYMD